MSASMTSRNDSKTRITGISKTAPKASIKNVSRDTEGQLMATRECGGNEWTTIKSLKVGTNPVLKNFATSHYIRAGGSEAASDVLVQVV